MTIFVYLCVYRLNPQNEGEELREHWCSLMQCYHNSDIIQLFGSSNDFLTLITTNFVLQ